MALHESTKIVTVDVPDPDNFLMVLRVLKDNPKEKVSVVLSPRPVDLRAVPYGDKFGPLLGDIMKKFPDESDSGKPGRTQLARLLGRVSSDNREWVKRLEPHNQHWFYNDAGFGDQSVDEDTELYMQVSALRLIVYLEAHDIRRDQYQLYHNEKAKDSIVIGVRHASHKPDWSWGFSDSLKSEFADALKNARESTQQPFQPLSNDLRAHLRKLLHSYIRTTSAKLLLKPAHLFQDFQELMDFNHAQNTRPDIYVGGPFTEAAAYSEHESVNHIVGMGGFINGEGNIFPNQFNFLVDMKAAQEVLQRGEHGSFDLTLVPTECIKGSPYDFCDERDADGKVVRTGADVLNEKIGQASPATVDLYEQWTGNCSLFDLIAAMYVSVPELYNTRNVTSFLENGIIRFKEDSNGKIKMCWNDNEHMESNKATFHKALVDTFSKPEPRMILHRANSSL